MRNKRPISDQGKAIKMMLVQLDMTQSEFCRQYGIPQNRLCDIIHSDSASRRQIPLRLKLYKIMQEVLKEQKKSV